MRGYLWFLESKTVGWEPEPSGNKLLLFYGTSSTFSPGGRQSPHVLRPGPGYQDPRPGPTRTLKGALVALPDGEAEHFYEDRTQQLSPRHLKTKRLSQQHPVPTMHLRKHL